MSVRMTRFLTSIGLDPASFDMEFDSIAWADEKKEKVLLKVRKSHAFTAEEFNKFQEGLGRIDYPYDISFVYDTAPSFFDINDLFNSWVLSLYRVVPSVSLTSSKEGEFSISDTDLSFDQKRIIKDFEGLLSFLNYPWKLTSKEIIEKAKSEEVNSTISDNEETSNEPSENEEVEREDVDTEEVKENIDDECNEDGEPEDEPSVEVDDSHHSEVLDAEKAYLAAMKNRPAHQNKKSNFGWRNYEFYPSIAMLYSLDSGNVEFEGEVYKSDPRQTRTGKTMNVIGVGDESSAISVRLFESNRGELDAATIASIKAGERYRIQGSVTLDKYTSDKIILANSCEKIPPVPLRGDSCLNKRVELHLHTKMSAMDGVGDIKAYCAVAKNMGMSALAVTDHGDIQAFPAAEAAGKKSGMKIIYGIEFNMFDWPVYVYNAKPILLTKAKYCVFDFETTGLSSRYDKPTEFGAVIVENGSITRRMDQFINGGVHISDMISAKTHITDQMIKDAPNEVDAVKMINDFIGDAVLVSHNAPFDIGFLNAMRAKAGMGPIENPVIDTLALSHYLFPKAARHKLGSLSKNLGLGDYDDDDAHRADYDAEALNNVWQAIIPILTKKNPAFEITDFNDLASDDPELFKHLKSYHMVALAKNQEGLKSLYRLVSDSETTFLATGATPIAKIPRSELIKERENLLYGSACFNGYVFEVAAHKGQAELEKEMAFYDYIEVQPKENYSWLVNVGEITNERLDDVLKSIVSTAEKLNKKVCATGDCHYVNPEEKICRDVYISAKALGGSNHPLHPHFRDRLPAFPNPDQHFRSTEEMFASFSSWLPKEKCEEIIVNNTNDIANLCEPLQILKNRLYAPNANLPGSDDKLREICYSNLAKTYGEHPDQRIVDRLEKELHGIISNGYSVTYYIAHLIIKKANADGYIVGSRGSVGSSFAAHMAGITEVNPLAPNYLCPKCHHFEWSEDKKLRSGFDLPVKKCPVCGEEMIRDGQSIPFETFLGFSAEKVPDIDLNFPQDYQSTAHAYTRELLSTKEENEMYSRKENVSNPHVIRAGTIATAEEKNAFGYVKGYYERILHEDWASVNKAYAGYIASKCVGVKRTTGQHPGGIVVIPADMDIFDFTPYQHPADDPNAEWLTTHYEFASMHDSVLKLDLLGHVDPMALRMMSLLTNIDIHDVPMTDPKVISLFYSSDALKMKSNPLKFRTGAVALPEFGTDFVQGILEKAHPQTFNDLLIISGLSHGTDVWNNNAEELISKNVATLDEVIGCRDDIMNYLISVGVPDSISFKIMEDVRHGKKLKPEYEEEMKKQNVPQFYIDSCNKIKYLFPRAHATAYVMGAIRVAWFKVYRPLEFYATYFSTRCDRFDIAKMCAPLDKMVESVNDLRARSQKKMDFTDTDKEIMKSLIAAVEMVDRGYKVEMISLSESLAGTWKVCHERNSIIPPFSVISGFGVKAADGIVNARKDGSFISKEDLKDRAGIGDASINALSELGVLDGLGDTNQMSLFDFGL